MKDTGSMTKPYQWLAWLATAVLVSAASLASFVPALEIHHYAFIVGGTLWIVVGYLWQERSLIVLNTGLNVIYIMGMIY